MESQPDGRDVTIDRGYQRDGKILYDGIDVVMQGTRGTSESVLYDKSDLLSRAANRSTSTDCWSKVAINAFRLRADVRMRDRSIARIGSISGCIAKRRR